MNKQARLYTGYIFLAMFVSAFILFRLLMVSPITGVADKGDYWRNAEPFGLRSIEHSNTDKYFLYLNRKYAFDSYNPLFYYSSQQLLVATAVLINALVSTDGLFDLRVMGGVNALAYLIVLAIAFTAIFRRAGLPNGAILSGLFVFIFLDVGYVSYFNSFYSEPIAYIALLAATSCLALLDQHSGSSSASLFLGFVLATLLLITSKSQYAPLGLGLAILGWRQARYLPLSKTLRGWIQIGLPILILVSSLVFLALSTPLAAKQANQFNAVFYGILLTSPNAPATLTKLGVDPSLSELRGTLYWQLTREYARSVELKRKFYNHITIKTIAEYYLMEPSQFLRQVELAVRETSRLVPGELGQFEKSSGLAPHTHATLFSGWTALRRKISPQSWQALGWFYLLNIATGLIVRLRKDQTPGLETVSELHLCLVAMSMMALTTSIIGEGQADITKHLFLFNAINDICLFILVGYLLAGSRNAWHGFLKSGSSDAESIP